jgi:hypothetical protein
MIINFFLLGMFKFSVEHQYQKDGSAAPLVLCIILPTVNEQV